MHYRREKASVASSVYRSAARSAAYTKQTRNGPLLLVSLQVQFSLGWDKTPVQL